MKKVIFAFISLCGLGANAQNFYNFTVEPPQEYTDLTDATSINNGQVWEWDQFAEVSIPFSFSVMGESVDRFLFDDDGFVLLKTGTAYSDGEGEINDESIIYLYPESLFIQDRTLETNVSSSPISYQVSGTEGNRILKLEVKNAGLELYDEYNVSEDYFYLNYQIWLYEADNVIEYHYGGNNISQDAVDSEWLLVFLGTYETAGFLTGDSTSPAYNEFTEANAPQDPPLLNDYPASGMVYRFGPANTTGIAQHTLNKIVLYPNPAASVLTVNTGTLQAAGYTVTDAMGKRVMQSNTPFTGSVTVNVQSLAPGMYFVQAGNVTAGFIKN